MSDNNFHYDAFISYRHSEADKFVAENLHKKLEAFKMPSVLEKKRPGLKNKIERVFRDKEELPLTSDLNDPIMNALHNSDWLIVICSPRLRESLWCKKEIETFVSLHGREHLLAVLIEGEPSESFPDELLFKTETKTLPDGSVEEVKIPIEPLAADVRGANKKEILKAMDTEVLRILAAMFGVNYDDLRQRHRERQQKRIMRWVIAGGIACLLFGIFCAGVAFKLNQKNHQIQTLADSVLEQSEEINAHQARSLAEKALRYLEDGDCEEAIHTAIMSGTVYEYVTMPNTSETQYALAETLYAYDVGSIYHPRYQLETMGVIESIDLSPDENVLGVYDSTGTFTLFDINTQEVLLEVLSQEAEGCEPADYAFLVNNRFAYVDEQFDVVIFDIGQKSEYTKIDSGKICSLWSDNMGKYLVAETLFDEWMIYDGNTLECLGCIEQYGDGVPEYVSVSEDGILTWGRSVAGREKIHDVYFLDCKTMSEPVVASVANLSSIKDVALDDGVAYILGSKSGDSVMDTGCYVAAVDLKTGMIIWEDLELGCSASYICLPNGDIKKELLVLSDRGLSMIDMATGEVCYRNLTPAKPIYAIPYLGDDYYDVYCEDGSLLYIDSTLSDYADNSYEFDCKTDIALVDYNAKDMMFTVAPNDNRVIIYAKEKAEAVVQVQTAVDIPELVYLEGNYAKEAAQKYGLEKAEYVKTLFTDEKGYMVYASYYNNDFVVFDTVQGETIITLRDYPIMNGYFCEDYDEGYTYIRGEEGGYLLSVEYEIMMFIPGMVGVNLDENKVYISSEGNLYEAPIYSYIDLLRIATPYMNEDELRVLQIKEDEAMAIMMQSEG